MVGMAFDPLEQRLYAKGVALLNLGQDALDDIFVLDRLPGRRLPPIPAPVDVPYGYAVDRILAIGDDGNVSIPRCDLESS